MGVLADTCVWIDVARRLLAPADVERLARQERVFLSPVVIAELRFGADSTQDPAERQKRLAFLRRMLRRPTLVIDVDTGEIFGSISAELKATGRHSRHRSQDLWLASQAVQHGFGFLTRNKREFEDISGLHLLTYALAK